MAEKRTSWLLPVFQGFVGNALYSISVLIFGGIVTYFAYATPGLIAALLKGFLASVMVIVATLVWKIMLVLPPRRQPTTPENIEERIKEWLYKHNLSIKNDPHEKTHFRMFVTTDGGRNIFIGRRKDRDSGSILLTADLKANPEEVSLAESLSIEERLRFLFELRLEFSRAKIAYNGLDYVNGFSLVKSVPLTSNLGETDLMKAFWELEAVVNSGLVVILMAAQRHRMENPVTGIA